jgi:GNAT superfamily N-acetyltransferase
VKRVNYRISMTHPLRRTYGYDVGGETLAALRKLPMCQSGHEFLLEHCTGTPADYVVVATTNRRIIGFFRFEVDSYGNSKPMMFASGTWVDPKYRRRGIATTMWRRAVDFAQPVAITTSVTSEEGEQLVFRLKESPHFRRKHPNVKWSIDARALRA